MARILLVDDEKIAQSMYGDYLASAGHEVTAAGTVAAARDALEKDRYDAVVTDLLLPEGDGMEVLQFAKERSPGTEIIVITALDKVDPAVRAIKSGAAEYLTKPVTQEALQHAVARALTTRRLLDENAALRRHVALVEAGQRLVAMLDRDKLMAAAAGAFAQLTEAHASLLFLKTVEGIRRQAVHGLSEEEATELDGTLLERISAAGGTAFAEATDGETQALGFPISNAEGPLGYAVLMFKGAVPESVPATAAYLAQHVSLALNNVGRIAAVEDMVYIDDLTHLFNARYLEVTLEKQLQHAEQTKHSFSLLFLDLDYFKSINDTHGHLVGSKLLVEAGRIIKSCTRDLDVVTRWGGDEYVVLLKDTDSGGALKVAERIRRAMEKHHFLAREGFGLSLTTCIGIASYPEHAQDKATLLDLADRAMYRGKKTSRNVIYVAAKGLEATPQSRHNKQ
jgi:diguanylate cyclase (GGDEF)-like protein